MLSYRYNVPSSNSTRIATIDKDPPPPTIDGAGRQCRDWKEIERRAECGLLPPAPRLSKSGERIAGKLKREISSAAQSGNLAVLTLIEIRPYNSTMRTLKRYQRACIAALKASKVAS